MSERGAGVGPGETLRLRLVVNRRPVELLVPPHRTLLEVLREELGLTGTKHGCELGKCGACAALNTFRYFVSWFWLRALRKRSQKTRLTPERMRPLVARYLPLARITHPYPSARLRLST